MKKNTKTIITTFLLTVALFQGPYFYYCLDGFIKLIFLGPPRRVKRPRLTPFIAIVVLRSLLLSPTNISPAKIPQFTDISQPFPNIP
jgi:hypothetical protein